MSKTQKLNVKKTSNPNEVLNLIQVILKAFFPKSEGILDAIKQLGIKIILPMGIGFVIGACVCYILIIQEKIPLIQQVLDKPIKQDTISNIVFDETTIDKIPSEHLQKHLNLLEQDVHPNSRNDYRGSLLLTNKLKLVNIKSFPIIIGIKNNVLVKLEGFCIDLKNYGINPIKVEITDKSNEFKLKIPSIYNETSIYLFIAFFTQDNYIPSYSDIYYHL